jgi:hypothetical protein
MGKVTLNLQILESIQPEGRKFFFGGFQRDPDKEKMAKKVIEKHFSSL